MGDKHTTQPRGSCIVLSCIDTLRCQQKELRHKGGQKEVHDACIVHTAAGEKA